MKPAQKLRLTASMHAALEKAILYGDPAHGLVGRSSYGGFTRTLSALRYHGLLDWQNQPTEAGRKAAGYRNRS
jgi:hypothetical protein